MTKACQMCGEPSHVCGSEIEFGVAMQKYFVQSEACKTIAALKSMAVEIKDIDSRNFELHPYGTSHKLMCQDMEIRELYDEIGPLRKMREYVSGGFLRCRNMPLSRVTASAWLSLGKALQVWAKATAERNRSKREEKEK